MTQTTLKYAVRSNDDTVTTDLPVQAKTANYTVSAMDDIGREVSFDTSTSNLTASLPTTTSAGNGFNVILRNAGSGTLTIDPSGAETIDGNATLDLVEDEVRWIRGDGNAWKTVSSHNAEIEAGTVLQTVTEVDQTQVTETSGAPLMPRSTTPTNTDGQQYMSVSITPKRANSRLLVSFNGVVSNEATGNQVAVALFKDNTVNAEAVTATTLRDNQSPYIISLVHEVAATSTSEVTFKIRAGGHKAGLTTFNGQSNFTPLHGGKTTAVLSVQELAV